MEHPDIPGVSNWSPLARGGLAVVWRAQQLSLDRLVAVKVYERGLDEGDRHRFRREADAVGRLSNHPGIVTAYDAGTLPDDRHYLMMELCPGGSLTRWLKPENRPSEERVRQVGVEIARALSAAHACGVLHRDVKPANILIDSYGNPRLADFGLAVVEGVEAVAAEALGVTPAYAPPEVLSMQPATEFSDVFSLAATLYALLAGRTPRRVGAAPISFEQMVEVAKAPIAPLPGVNWYFMDVLLTALSNDPATRPTASRFAGQLANLPAPRTSHRGLRLPVDQSASAGLLRGRSAARHSATSNNHDIAVTAETQRTPVRAAEPSRSRGKRRVGLLALAAALVTVTAPATAWLISDPASSAVPAATTPSTPNRAKSATATSETTASTASSSLSTSGPAAIRAEQLLTTCQRKVRAGDTAIRRAKVGVEDLSERFRAQIDPNAGRINLDDAKRIFTPTGAAEPGNIKRYKAAVKVYADRKPCTHMPNAPIETAIQLKEYSRCQRAQKPVLAAAADLLADWESHQAELRRSRTGQHDDAESVWIRTWISTAPHVTAWNQAVARYQAGKC